MGEGTTLGDLLELQLHRVEDEVKNIVDKAVKEMAIEKVRIICMECNIIFSTKSNSQNLIIESRKWGCFLLTSALMYANNAKLKHYNIFLPWACFRFFLIFK